MRFLLVLGLAVACNGAPGHEHRAAASQASQVSEVAHIVVRPGARLAADAIGDGGRRATFVLVDAANQGSQGLYVTLEGALTDAAGAVLDPLAQQSLFVPAGEARTFALVDRAQKERPDAKGAQVVVRSAVVPMSVPPVRVDGVREVPDYGKLVVQGVVHNDSNRAGDVVAIGAFHGSDGTPVSRPFTVVHLAAHAEQAVQFVGSAGAAHATIFFGDVTF